MSFQRSGLLIRPICQFLFCILRRGLFPSSELPTKKKVNWREYNEELVRRGELLFDPAFLSGWRNELEKSNEGKEGARYRYPGCLMSMLAAIHVYLLPYRQLEGFARVFAEHVELFREAPDYSTIWWRVSRVKVDIDPSVDRTKDVTIAVDSTGIKVSNRGEWMRQKWQVKRGFIKFHVAVDVRTGKMLSEVEEYLHLPPLRIGHSDVEVPGLHPSLRHYHPPSSSPLPT